MINEIKAHMAKVWNVDRATIPDNAALGEFGPWDSLGHVGLLLALEEKYGLEVTGDTIVSLRNIDAIAAALEIPEANPDQRSPHAGRKTHS